MTPPVIQVNYEQLEQIAQLFSRHTQQFEAYDRQLRQMTDQLKSGWIGMGADAFFDEMEGEILPRLKRLIEAFEASNRAVTQISEVMAAAEEQAGGVIRDVGSPGSVGGGVPGGGSVPGVATNPFQMEHPNVVRPNEIPMHLLRGSRVDLYQGILEGQITPEQAREFMQNDPFRRGFMDYVDAKAILWEDTRAGQSAMFEAMYAGDLGAVRASAMGERWSQMLGVEITPDGRLSAVAETYNEFYLGRAEGQTRIGDLQLTGSLTGGSAELTSETRLGIGRDGINAELNGSAGIYVARAEVGAQIAGIEANAQAYVGAEVSVENSAVINPFNGNVSVSSSAEAFAGGRVRGDISYSNDYFRVGVEGQASYGAGAGYNASVGYNDGVFRVDAGAFASLGVGAGGRGIVEVNVGQMATDVVSWGSNLLFGD